VVEAQ